jgi:hypothetical protein
VAGKKAKLLLPLLISLLSFSANIVAFLHSYRSLAFPFLSEEQRVANADFIMTISISAFAAAAIFTGVLLFWALSRPKQ